MKKLGGEKGIIGGIATLALLFQASLVGAQTLTNPLGPGATFTTVSTAIIGFIFWDIAMPLSVIMILVGAFQFMTSSGDPEKVSKARKTIMYAAIGFAIALCAGGAASLIQSLVKGS